MLFFKIKNIYQCLKEQLVYLLSDPVLILYLQIKFIFYYVLLASLSFKYITLVIHNTLITLINKVSVLH